MPHGILLPFILQFSISTFLFDTEESEMVVPLLVNFRLAQTTSADLHVPCSAANSKQTRFRIYYSHISLERIYLSIYLSR